MALALDTNPQDLLVLRDAVVALATSIVESGDYVSLTINLDQERSNVVEAGEERPLRIPSEEIKILGGFAVGDDGVTTVTLDFDAEKSLVCSVTASGCLHPSSRWTSLLPSAEVGRPRRRASIPRFNPLQLWSGS